MPFRAVKGGQAHENNQYWHSCPRRRWKDDLDGDVYKRQDCNRALKFYSGMFGFQLLQDNDGNMELTNNLDLQELGYWEQFTKRSVISNSNQSELYLSLIHI